VIFDRVFDVVSCGSLQFYVFFSNSNFPPSVLRCSIPPCQEVLSCWLSRSLQTSRYTIRDDFLEAAGFAPETFSVPSSSAQTINKLLPYANLPYLTILKAIRHDFLCGSLFQGAFQKKSFFSSVSPAFLFDSFFDSL